MLESGLREGIVPQAGSPIPDCGIGMMNMMIFNSLHGEISLNR